MSVLNQLLSKEIAEKAWEQLQKMLFPSDRKQIKQLISLKPIEIYETKSSFNIDGADIQVGIKSYLENILENRKNIRKKWLGLAFGTQESLTYGFHVVVNSAIDYPNAKIYLQNNYVDNPFNFNNDRYQLTIKDVDIKEKEKELSTDLSLEGSINIWFLKIRTKGILNVIGNPYYQTKDKTIRMKDLKYTFKSKNLVLKLLDKYYHKRFLSFLKDLIIIPIDEALFKAKILAQEEMNHHQKESRFVFNGILNDLELERLKVEERTIKAVFLAQGNLRLAK